MVFLDYEVRTYTAGNGTGINMGSTPNYKCLASVEVISFSPDGFGNAPLIEIADQEFRLDSVVSFVLTSSSSVVHSGIATNIKIHFFRLPEAP